MLNKFQYLSSVMYEQNGMCTRYTENILYGYPSKMYVNNIHPFNILHN
jgi:hypothetical protein